METDVTLTGYDFLIVGLFALFVARGLWLGLLKQVTGLLALCLGYYFASQYHDRLFPFLKDLLDNPKLVFIASFVLLFVLTFALVMLLGKVLSFVVDITFSKWFDRLLGALLGAVKAFVVVVLLHMFLSSVLAPGNAMVRDCQTCSGLDEVAEYARVIIRDEEVRKSLMQQTPAITTDEVIKFFDEAMQEKESGYVQSRSSAVE